jgi:hypothetical protein
MALSTDSVLLNRELQMIAGDIFVVLGIFLLLVYLGWFAFFPKHAFPTQKRLPWGIRMPLIPVYTRLMSIIGFFFVAFLFGLLMYTIITGTPQLATK